jgi:16S rRNA (guanine1207-N2)-methyltransferase
MSEAMGALMYGMQAWESPPQPDKRILLLNAAPESGLEAWRGQLVLTQRSKAVSTALESAGWVVSLFESLGEQQFDEVWLLPDRQRDCQMADLAEAWSRVRPGAYLVVSIRNDWGGKRLEEHAREVFGVEVQTLSKHHCRVFRLIKEEAKAKHETLERWARAGALRRLPDTGYWSQPGLFSWDRVDLGSKLLAESLPDTLAGAGADLGAGWGYLSTELLKRCPNVDALDCFEADGRTLEPARRNLGNVMVPLRPRIYWRDVTAGVGIAKYDFILMNPPFHEGRDADPGLGIKFIAAAARALKRDGTLWMVANKHLPYEEVLQDAFNDVRAGAQRLGFKILVATGPNPKLHQTPRQRRKGGRR